MFAPLSAHFEATPFFEVDAQIDLYDGSRRVHSVSQSLKFSLDGHLPGRMDVAFPDMPECRVTCFAVNGIPAAMDNPVTVRRGETFFLKVP